MKKKYSILAGNKIGFIIVFLFMVNILFSQEVEINEFDLKSTADSTQLDSLNADSTAEKEKFKLQSKIVYDADVVSLSRSKNKIYLLIFLSLFLV